jgi:hypothetical protein
MFEECGREDGIGKKYNLVRYDSSGKGKVWIYHTTFLRGR